MSLLSCEQVVRQHIEAVSERFSCTQRDGKLWIVSPYTYPDGDFVEAAVWELSTGQALATDLGETLRRLATHGFDPRVTSRGAYLLSEISKQHNVSLERGMLVKRSGPAEAGSALQDVLAASLAVSHLLFLSRGYRPATFQEEVGQMMTGLGITYDAHHYEIGQVTQKRYPIDFFLRGRQRDGLVQALSPTIRGGSVPVVNATFRLWSDVPNGRWRATLLDNRELDWRPEDLALLKGVSDVHFWTERQRFEHSLVQVVGAEQPSQSS